MCGMTLVATLYPSSQLRKARFTAPYKHCCLLYKTLSFIHTAVLTVYSYSQYGPRKAADPQRHCIQQRERAIDE